METTKKNEVINKVDEQRFEFLLYINDKIICQRFFNIWGYNEKAIGSFDLNNMSHDCVEIIKRSMKNKTLEYLWKYYDPYKEQEDSEISKRGIYEKIDDFQFEVRIDKKSVIKRQFNGNPYPPKVRYQVDIKDIIHDIISNVRYHLTKDEYVYNFKESESVA